MSEEALGATRSRLYPFDVENIGPVIETFLSKLKKKAHSYNLVFVWDTRSYALALPFMRIVSMI